MATINKILRNLEFDEKTPKNYQYLRKIYLLRILIFVGIILFAVYAIRSAIREEYPITIINTISFAVLILLNFKLKKRPIVDFISYFGSIFILLYILLLNIYDYTNPMSLIWAFLYPLIIYFLVNIKYATIFSLILMISLFLLNRFFGFENILFNQITYFDYFTSYLTIIIILYIIQIINNKILKLFKYSYKELLSKNNELQLANKIITGIENKYKNIVNFANDAIILIENWKIIFANKKVFEITGYTEQEIINNDFLEFVHPDERTRIKKLRNQRINSGIVNQPYETIIITKDGNEINIEVSDSIIEENGRKLFLIIMRDITLRKIQQEEREILINQLEETRKKLLKDKEELLKLNEELVKSQENLQNTINLKDKFLSIISHDLINPISGSKHLISLLYNDYNNLEKDEIMEFLSALKQTSYHVETMLQTLILWAKSQSNQLKPSPINFDINELIFTIKSLLSTQALDKMINIIQDSSGNINVFADINMTNTILRNLVSNAIKFTPDNGQINIGAKEINDHFVEVYVKDNGIGMSNDTKENLFNISNRHTNLGTKNEKGYGLGLLIVKDFVELNSGKLTVESEINKGTTFKFTLPKYHEK